MMRTPERAGARKGPHGRPPGAVLVTPAEAGNRKRVHEGEAPAAAPVAAKRRRQEEEEEEENPGGDAPELGATEWLRDDHFTYVMEQWLPKAPQHVWTACPAQVALLRSGVDATDVHSARDGSLRDLWDADHVRTLILPLNCDPHAGKRVGAGQHWSLLVVRREEGPEPKCTAEVLESLSTVPAQVQRGAQDILRRLQHSRNWQEVPRRPKVVARGLQRDDYQCGVFCLLAMHEVTRTEAGETAKACTGAAARLRAELRRLGRERQRPLSLGGA
jgi:hypothetical protein